MLFGKPGKDWFYTFQNIKTGEEFTIGEVHLFFQGISREAIKAWRVGNEKNGMKLVKKIYE